MKQQLSTQYRKYEEVGRGSFGAVYRGFVNIK